ncbi:MAG TPA: histidine phosphatase family protein [Polyangiaceae bacterium]|nr:histidine phosphatase family protein [Polyangiaceae bacterium]
MSTWPTRLWLVRHGESAGNLALLAAETAGAETIEIEGRDVDVPLSERGRRQARALGQWLHQQPANEQPSLIVSSPYARALETARQLSHELPSASASCLVDERLREKEFGELNRFTKAGISTRFPEEARRRAELGKFYYRPPGGESWCDVALRVRAFVQDLQLAHAGERVLVVAHQVIVLCFRYVVERLDERQLLEIDRAGDVANCSITSFKAAGTPGRERLELLEYNFVTPLEEAGEPVTTAPDPAVIK